MREVNLERASVLLAYVALVVSTAALAAEVPLVYLLIFGGAAIAGVVADVRGYRLPVPGPRLMALVLLMGVALSLIGVTLENLLSRLLGMVLLVAAARFVAPKAARDILQMYLLNVVVLAGAAAVQWSLGFGVLILAEAFVSVVGLVFTQGSREAARIRLAHAWYLVRWSALVTVLLLPLSAGFFFMLPRPMLRLLSWSLGTTARSGFRDKVAPGDVASIMSDGTVAFRARWLRGARPERCLWRGTVYDSYVDGVWTRSLHGAVQRPKVTGTTVAYEIVLEPTFARYLFCHGLPFVCYSKSLKAYLAPGYTLEVEQDIERRSLYRVDAVCAEALPLDLPLDMFLRVPDTVERTLRPLAEALSAESDSGTATGIMRYLHQTCAYTLAPGESKGDPVVRFLFRSHRGHCEYFASAMALLLRTAGVPARVVGGYVGGEWNDMGEYYVVRQSRAHAWVEAWLEGTGWVTYDPTPGSGTPYRPKPRAAALRWLDYMRLQWYYWVLDYDIQRQVDIALGAASTVRGLRSGQIRLSLLFHRPSRQTTAAAAAALAGMFAVWAAVRWYGRRPKSVGERFVRAMAKRGFALEPGETIRELAMRARESDASLGERALQFAESYYAWLYGNRAGRHECLDRLRKLPRR